MIAPRSPAERHARRAGHVATYQMVDILTPGLTIYAGVNSDAARRVAAETGAAVTWPYATTGFMDAEGRCLVVVFHNCTAPDGSAELAVVNYGLALSRPILAHVAAVVFDEGRASELVMRVPIGDLRTRDALRRLGFVRKGTMAGRHIYALTPDRIPEPYRRARARRRH